MLYHSWGAKLTNSFTINHRYPQTSPSPAVTSAEETTDLHPAETKINISYLTFNLEYMIMRKPFSSKSTPKQLLTKLATELLCANSSVETQGAVNKQDNMKSSELNSGKEFNELNENDSNFKKL